MWGCPKIWELPLLNGGFKGEAKGKPAVGGLLFQKSQPPAGLSGRRRRRGCHLLGSREGPSTLCDLFSSFEWTYPHGHKENGMRWGSIETGYAMILGPGCVQSSP